MLFGESPSKYGKIWQALVNCTLIGVAFSKTGILIWICLGCIPFSFCRTPLRSTRGPPTLPFFLTDWVSVSWRVLQNKSDSNSRVYHLLAHNHHPFTQTMGSMHLLHSGYKYRGSKARQKILWEVTSWIHQFGQWLFLVPLIGGRYHIITQLAVYTTYIPLIYCQLGDYMVPTTY